MTTPTFAPSGFQHAVASGRPSWVASPAAADPAATAAAPCEAPAADSTAQSATTAPRVVRPSICLRVRAHASAGVRLAALSARQLLRPPTGRPASSNDGGSAVDDPPCA